MLLWMLVSMPLGGVLSACASPPVIYLSANNCAGLVPEEWSKDGVPSAPLPADHSIGEWVAFGDAQTAQLDKANDQTHDAVSIVSKCEDRDRQIYADLTKKPWWKIW